MTSTLNSASVALFLIFWAGSEDEAGQRVCESEEEKRRKDDGGKGGWWVYIATGRDRGWNIATVT